MINSNFKFGIASSSSARFDPSSTEYVESPAYGATRNNAKYSSQPGSQLRSLKRQAQQYRRTMASSSSSSPRPGGGGNPYFSLFLRAIGVKQGFRRAGPSSLLNIAFVSLVGVVSGHYIFSEPLRQHFQEQQELERQQQQQQQDESNNAQENT